MASKPVVFLAFANDQDAHLAFLRQEEDNIYSSLQEVHDSGYIEIYNRGRATIEDIFTQFTRYRDRVAIFHYAGHANGTHLRLIGSPARAEGLAQLMGQQENLKLVFLNGCSTQDQVKSLFDAGVKAIIATSTPIADTRAVTFATQFYQSLASRATIEQSFEESVSRLVTEHQANPDEIQVVSYRDWVSNNFKEGVDPIIPWGLYVNDPEILHWKLPEVNKNLFNDPWVGTRIESHEVNRHIVAPVFESMSEYNPLFAEQLNFLKSSSSPAMLDLLFRQMMDQIIKHFPWPIGIKLRTLFSSDDSMIRKTKSRFDQLISTYVRLSKFLLYILLSQFWDYESTEGESFEIPNDYLAEIKEFLMLNPKNYKEFDYLFLMGVLIRLFQENKISPFIQQFESVFESVRTQDEFYKSYKYLESLREQAHAGTIGANQFQELCDKAEYSLGLLLKKCAFLVDYRLISVKDIGVSKPRRQKARFRHQMGVLAGVAIEVMEGTPKNYEHFTDSHSILLVKGVEEIKDYLNLSPFIIDENAFKQINAPKIYMYAFNQDFGSFFYEHVDNDSAIAIPELMADENIHNGLLEQFDLLKQEMLD